MTSSQLSEWIAYAQLEPFGTGIEDQRTGIICACVMNAVLMANHDPKKGKPKWYKPEDFIPDYLSEPVEKKRQKVDDMKAIMQTIAGVK